MKSVGSCNRLVVVEWVYARSWVNGFWFSSFWFLPNFVIFDNFFKNLVTHFTVDSGYSWNWILGYVQSTTTDYIAREREFCNFFFPSPPNWNKVYNKATKYVDFNTQKIKWMLGFCGPRIRITTIVRPYSPCFWVIFRFKIQISALIVSPADNAQRIWNWHGSSLARQDKRYEGIKCEYNF